MKILFNNFKPLSPYYTKQRKQTYNKNISFKGDDLEQQQEAKVLGEKYKNLSKKLKDFKKQRNIDLSKQRVLIKDIINLNNRYAILNDILNNSGANDFKEDEKILIDYMDRMENLGKQRGFNKIAGYDDIKQTLMNEFILKIMAKARTSQKTDVPNAFLFFGLTGAGKTTFANALAEQSLSYVENIDAGELCPEETMQLIKEKAKIAKNNYSKGNEKRRTIIVVNEADVVSSQYSPVVEELVDFIKNCADKYKCTLFLTTNNPLDIDRRILDENVTPKKIAIKPADCETAKKIIEQKLTETGETADIADKLAEFLFSDPKRQYSNANIVNIIDKTLRQYKNPKLQNYIETAQNKVYPSISKKTFEKLEKEIKALNDLDAKYDLEGVAGMEELKKELYEDIIGPMSEVEKYRAYGIEPVNGFLLYGAPGCGKTFIMKALAKKLNRTFIEITPSNTISKYMGETAQNIKNKFQEAKDNSPSIIFIDEIEAIAPNRETLSGAGADIDINQQVNELLGQMNNCRDEDILIICASNEPQRIDKAIKRTGRLDKKIFVSNPDDKTRMALFKEALSKIKNKNKDIDYKTLAQLSDYYTAEDIRLVVREAALRAMDDDTLITNEHLINALNKIPPSLNEDIVKEYRHKGEI